MRFSIIIPAYNSENTIRRTLSSVLAQTYQDFEVLIIDDGSTDKTKFICAEFSALDKRFKYIFQNNSGVSSARNKGIKCASGEFLAFLDSDDAYDSNYLFEFNTLIEKNPDCDNYWCKYKTICSKNVSFNEEVIGTENRNDVIYTDTDRDSIMSMHAETLDAPLWNKVFRKDIVKKNNIQMPANISLGEDLIFNYIYLDNSRKKIVVLNKEIYIYTKSDDGSLDSKYRENLKEIYDYLDNNLLYFLSKWKISEDEMLLFYNSVFYSQERILNNTFHPQSNLTFFEKYKFNKSILKSDKFNEALSKSNCYIHPLYKVAYKIGSWSLIYLLNKIVLLKKMMSRTPS